MHPHLTLLTLGVSNLKLSRAFYERLGWKASSMSNEHVTFFHSTNGVALGLFGREALAADAHVSPEGHGFRAVTIAHNVSKKEDVARVLKEAEGAGAKIVKPAQDVFWGGHSGYFSDPDGHLWEVAWNPHAPVDANGKMTLPT